MRELGRRGGLWGIGGIREFFGLLCCEMLVFGLGKIFKDINFP